MNLLTYWFNPGIYKNTLCRFKWGSLLYTVILFFSVPFMFLTNSPTDMSRRYLYIGETIRCVLFDAGNFIIPMLTALVVPTVVALLVFNYAHSPKHGIFVHSLPVTRTQNYFSTLLAAFTLMFVPVILNGMVLLILNAFGYGAFLGTLNILKWIMINIFILFVMFSVSTAASFITGNAFAGAALNIIIHLIPLAIALSITLAGEVFLYGYNSSNAPFTMDIINYTPVVWIASNFKGSYYNQEIFSMGATYGYIIMAAVFYALAFLLYKLRRIENCGDVVAFAAAKPIIKYVLTSAAAIIILGILYGLGIASAATAFVVAAIISAIVYFACEMLMDKTLKVWGKYKGFLAFAVCAAVVISFCAFTSVFGYETRVPDVTDIKSVSMSVGYFEKNPCSESDEAALEVTQFHKNLLKDIPVTEKKEGSPLDVRYVLEDGSEITRKYYVPAEVRAQAMEIMFGYEDYKMAYTGLDNINIENVKKLNLEVSCPNFGYQYAMNEDSALFLKAVEEDIRTLNYSDFSKPEIMRFDARIHISPLENAEMVILKYGGEENRYYNFDITINSNYKNAMAFLKEKGYYNLAVSKVADGMYITKDTHNRDKQETEYYDYLDAPAAKVYSNHNLNETEVVKIDLEDAKLLINEHIAGNEYPDETGENYLVFIRDGNSALYTSSRCMAFTPETLPEYLIKYVD